MKGRCMMILPIIIGNPKFESTRFISFFTTIENPIFLRVIGIEISGNFLIMAKKWKSHGNPHFPGWHNFCEKCSGMAGEVVSAGARDLKSAVRTYLVAGKLSLASYFCLQTCSEPGWTSIFPGRDAGWGPPTTCS